MLESFRRLAVALALASAGFLLSTCGSSSEPSSNVPARVAITTQPGGAVSGVFLGTQPTVQIRDANDALVSTSAAAVTAAIGSGTGTLTGTTTVNAMKGVATFSDLRVNGAGAHTLVFTTPGLTSATSTAFTVTQVPVALSIQTQPAGAKTGAPLTIQPVIRVLDNAGLVVVGFNLNVTASVASGTGTLAGGASVAANNGIATFTNLRVDGTGSVTLIFSIATPTLQTAPSQSFVIAP